MLRAQSAIAMAAIALIIAGCAGVQTRSHVTELRRTSSKIVLMPLDVELSEMNAGGVLEPKADWTHAAVNHLTAALREEERRVGFDLTELPPATALSADDNDKLDQLNKLHSLVGKSIMIYRVVKLPNKTDQFEWSLGPEVSVLGDRTGADYALFIYMRDSYASDGRKAAMVAAAVLGVGLTAGQQVGFASLVDLKTGEVVWFNRLARGTGDARTAESAMETVKVLLSGFPK